MELVNFNEVLIREWYGKKGIKQPAGFDSVLEDMVGIQDGPCEVIREEAEDIYLWGHEGLFDLTWPELKAQWQQYKDDGLFG